MSIQTLFKVLLTGIFFIVGHSFPALAQSKPKLAILDIDSRGEITKDQAGILTDIIRSYLVKSQKFEILERTHIEAVLKEQGFQMTQNCNSSDCRIKVGQLLGVHGLVTGSLSRLGNMYTLSLRIVDVEHGKVLRDEFENCHCSIEDLAIKMAPKMVARLIQVDSEPSKAAVKAQPKTEFKSPEFKLPEFKLPEQSKKKQLKLSANTLGNFRLYKQQEKSVLWGSLLNFPLPLGYIYLEEWGWFWTAFITQSISLVASATYPYYYWGGSGLALTSLLMPIHGMVIANEKNMRSMKSMGLTYPQVQQMEQGFAPRKPKQETLPLFQAKVQF